jgi:hypothetical protein
LRTCAISRIRIAVTATCAANASPSVHHPPTSPMRHTAPVDVRMAAANVRLMIRPLPPSSAALERASSERLFMAAPS